MNIEEMTEGLKFLEEAVKSGGLEKLEPQKSRAAAHTVAAFLGRNGSKALDLFVKAKIALSKKGLSQKARTLAKLKLDEFREKSTVDGKKIYREFLETAERGKKIIGDVHKTISPHARNFLQRPQKGHAV